MRHRFSLGLICALTIAALCASARAQITTVLHEQPQGPVCALETIGTATVKTAVDGQTLALADGREVRLVAIDAPALAKSALDALTSGRTVTLKRHGADRDRYGRLLAYVFVEGHQVSLQRVLLTTGQARVAAFVGEMACAAELLQAERTARLERLGIWADPHYVIRGADQPAAILEERGRLTLVEGQVLSVRQSGATIYVNFGRRWSEDFTVTVPKRVERLFTTAGLELKKLSGRRVRVRGVIEERGGPWIEAVRPEQIEVVEAN